VRIALVAALATVASSLALLAISLVLVSTMPCSIYSLKICTRLRRLVCSWRLSVRLAAFTIRSRALKIRLDTSFFFPSVSSSSSSSSSSSLPSSSSSELSSLSYLACNRILLLGRGISGTSWRRALLVRGRCRVSIGLL